MNLYFFHIFPVSFIFYLFRALTNLSRDDNKKIFRDQYIFLISEDFYSSSVALIIFQIVYKFFFRKRF